MLYLFALSCAFGLFLLILAYVLRKRGLVQNETARKLVHFAHALTIAGWPVFIGYWFVIIAEVGFLGAVLFAQEYRLLHVLRAIDRKSWGEFFFPAGVIILALIAPPAWVFAVAVLLLGLADGAAALIGKRIKSFNYHFFGHRKSVAGTLAFFVVALVIMILAVSFIANRISHSQLLSIVIVIPLVTTLIENISPLGSDNLTVPLAVYFCLLLIGVVS